MGARRRRSGQRGNEVGQHDGRDPPPSEISARPHPCGAHHSLLRTVAGLVCGLLDGLNLPSAARLGQAAAASKVATDASTAATLSRDRLYELAGLD